jgi:hypothetical protein
MNRLSGDTMTVIEADAWERVGEELRRVDPVRYIELLRLAEGIVQAHKDPAARLSRDALHIVPEAKGSA